MGEAHLHIELIRRTLIVSGHRVDHAGGTPLAYQQMEILYGEFRTEVRLPWSVSAKDVEATYDSGLLTIVLPKAHMLRVPISEATD
jgi:HSP20 family molecular chaperone IbpA